MALMKVGKNLKNDVTFQICWANGSNAYAKVIERSQV